MLCDGDDEDFLSDLSCFDQRNGGGSSGVVRFWIDLAKLSCRVFAFESRQLFLTVGRNPRILLLTLTVMALVLGTGLAGLNSRRDVAIATSKRTASWIATDTSGWLQSQFQEVVKPLSAMQQAVTDSGYFDDIKDQNDEDDNKNNDISNICEDVEILEKWKSIVEPFNNDNNIGGLIVGYRLHPANITCLVQPSIEESAVRSNADHSLQSTHNHDEDQDKNQAAAGSLSSKFWRLATRDMFSSEQQPHVNVFGPFSTSPHSNSMNQDRHHLYNLKNGEDKLCNNFFKDQPNAVIDFDSILDLHGYNIPHAIGFVINFVNSQQRRLLIKDTYDRFADHHLQFYLTRTEGPDLEGKHIIQTIAFSEKYHLLNENNSLTVSLDIPNGQWIIRVGKIRGWTPLWYPWLLTFLVIVAMSSSLAVAMVMVGERLHQNILDELMSIATTSSSSSQLQRGGQTLVEKFHFVTIFSSDIVNITSLAGELGPEQMRTIIHDLYSRFDKLVEKHEVLKVETIGNTYMVVGGAPNRCTEPDAAERVALFALDAIDCAKKYQMEDGNKIDVRAGIASGAVVAGVVGDAKRRYCFSGNTVTCASQMESTSANMRIQCSDSTYRLLLEAPTHNFAFEQRIMTEDELLNGSTATTTKFSTKVINKANTSSNAASVATASGRFKARKRGSKTSTTPTWWINRAESRVSSSKSLISSSSNVTIMTLVSDVETSHVKPSPLQDSSAKSCSNLKTIHHNATNHDSNQEQPLNNSENWYRTGCQDQDITARTDKGLILIDRISSILLQFAEAVVRKHNINEKLSSIAKAQLRNFVVAIENTYNDNHFHSFFHAYHVIISMENLVKALHQEPATSTTKTHFHQDPLNAFALIFSALIHDAGHTGMTNKILEEQNNPLATRYNQDGEPIAERYSLDLAFERLFNNKCDDFLSAIIPTEIDKIKLCQVLFHSVLSTDITSKDRNQFSIKRYQLASDQVFDESALIEEPRMCPLASYLKQYFDVVGLPSSAIQKYPKEFKTTHSSLQVCVLNEHVMLVSDIAHLMQCWNNFIKWNFRLYKEIKSCHDRGLCDDPTNGWYDGQIWFLVNYVIPLATRFKSYFTSSFGDDLVKQAERNLHQWEIHGGKASKLMADAVIQGDDESTTLAEIYLLPIGSSRKIRD